MPRKQKQPKKTCYNPLSPEDLNFIKLIFEEKGWYGAKICREFPSKNWNPVTVNKNIKKLRELKASIRRNWRKAINMEEVRKSIEEFIPRCKKVGEVKGEPIKHFFG